MFDTLFYNREAQLSQLHKDIVDSRKLGENILVIGSAGVGKTSLLLRCFSEQRVLEGEKIHPIFCDCREEGDISLGLVSVRQSLVSKFSDYLKALESVLGRSVIPASMAMTTDVHEKYRLAVKVILALPASDIQQKFPVLFVDDIDYSPPEVQQELLGLLLPLLQSTNMVVAYAVRPPSARTIDFHQDSRVKMALRKARRIPVHPVMVRGFLETRLAYLLNEPQEEETKRRSFLTSLCKRSHNSDSLRSYVADFVKEEDLTRFPYPFDERVETFMQRITNGNINEIVDIAIAFLSYFHENGANLTVNEDGTFLMHRTDVVRALTDEGSHYKLFNLHKMKSEKRGRTKIYQNNSTVQNVLELLCVSPYAESGFYERLCGKPGKDGAMEGGLGHTEEEVKRAIEFCLTSHLIEEDVHPNSGPMMFVPTGLENRRIGPFVLTEKGDFYLHDFITWPAYCAAFEEPPGRSVFDMTQEGDVGRFQLERDIIEFLVSLLIAGNTSSSYLKVGKPPLYDFFVQNYRQGYWRRYASRSEDDPDGYLALSVEMFDNVIRRRGMCSSHQEEKRGHYYAIKPTKVKEYAEDANLKQWIDPDRFSAEEFKRFCQEHTSWDQ
jgi:hypothetical protein